MHDGMHDGMHDAMHYVKGICLLSLTREISPQGTPQGTMHALQEGIFRLSADETERTAVKRKLNQDMPVAEAAAGASAVYECTARTHCTCSARTYMACIWRVHGVRMACAWRDVACTRHVHGSMHGMHTAGASAICCAALIKAYLRELPDDLWREVRAYCMHAACTLHAQHMCTAREARGDSRSSSELK